MPIRITCTDCCCELNFPDEVAGKQVRCPKCDAELVAPGRVTTRPADKPRKPAPARQEAVRSTKPAPKTVEEPVPPKRPSGTAERRSRPTPPAESVGDPEEGAAKADQESAGKKKRKKKSKPEPGTSSAWKWWLIGGAGGFFILLVIAAVVVVVVLKPDLGGARQTKSDGPPGEWADAKSALRMAGPDPEKIANMAEIYNMGGEVMFAKTEDHPVVALRIHSPHASDSFMSVIRNYGQLKYLDVSYCRLTDFGLQQFHAMKQLDEINLKHTQVSNEGVFQLHQSLPNTKIDF
jgi:hypothetical protein